MEKANRNYHAIIPVWRECCRIYMHRSWCVMKYIYLYTMKRSTNYEKIRDVRTLNRPVNALVFRCRQVIRKYKLTLILGTVLYNIFKTILHFNRIYIWRFHCFIFWLITPRVTYDNKSFLTRLSHLVD